ncbi:MAG: deoxyribodipyrimidine photo-lyase, partial [Planctomycetota bacterium]|nr:deoxyribodipyrimidine photo-lyase [Planctomycetota bacterium]
MRTLVWFRTDLRLTDNTALFEAAQRTNKGLVALFTITESTWRDEFQWGEAKADFIFRQMKSLWDALAAKNIPVKLLIRDRSTELPEAILEIMSQCKCDALFFNKEYEIYERRRDRKVKAAIEAAGLDCFS